MKQKTNQSVEMAIKYGLLLIIIAWILSSCASSKSKSSSYQKTDSTSSHIENTVKTVRKDSVQVKKEETIDDNTIIIDFGDTGIYRPHSDSGFQDGGIYVTPISKDDYFSIDKDGNIKTSRIPKKVIIKNLRQEKKSDSVAVCLDVFENHSKIDETSVTDIQKTVTKEKKSFNLLWLLWLLLIPVGVWIYKNRYKIMAWYPF